MARRPPRYYDYERPPQPSRGAPPSGKNWLNYTSIAIFGGIFILGVGVGIGFSSTASFTPENVASREVIDRSAPNAELCVQYGASAMVADMRIFLSLNPFSVYVTQPTMRPGCILRRNNWAILEQKGLVSQEQVKECKNRMNTFGFTGVLEGSPRIDCVYQNDAAGNLFLNQPGINNNTKRESDSF